MGIEPDAVFEVRHFQLQRGEVLLTFTDGVSEARNPAGGTFTDKRLQVVLEEPAPSAAIIVDRIETALQLYMAGAEQADDITMLAARWCADNVGQDDRIKAYME